ncbi:TPA: YhcH/YjgK/YiaL family protein [Citrobacter werkmanii]|uniref:YhcH/YjgK/YiaL family protein n=1 Tax=Citrobacter youngae ATCC 29220 TaxID=500640 RepID=D4B9M3_9ENTR|nr:YhcH/YjgK/YiaL family protein [Citrobacter youngae]EFE08884.1 YhcH/YjgK/YiaL family protein [Citrobacter youngae ATCC 29220]
MIYGDIALMTPCQIGALHPTIAKVIRYLSQNDLSLFPPGEKFYIQDDTIFFTVVEPMTKPLNECRPEVHRKYLDVHFLIAGQERICVSFDDGKNEVIETHPGERDVTFYAGDRIKDNVVTLTPGQFVIVFPEEVHRACYMVDHPEKIKKTVVKIDLSLL